MYNLIQEKKNNVYVITLQTNNDYIAKRLLSNGVNVIPIALKPGNLIKGFFNLYKFLNKIKPTQFHGWMYHGNLIAFFISLFYKKSLLFFNVRQALHSFKQEKLLTRIVILFNALFSINCKYIVYNSIIGIKHHELIGFDSNKSIYIPNGIDTKTFIPCIDKRKLFRNKLGINKETKVISMLARYDPIKGHKIFLEAAIYLSVLEPNALFVLAGYGLNTLNSKFSSLIYGLGDRLIIMDHQNDVCELLNGIDILTVCSVSEGFPNVLGEAMAVGTICVSSNAGDAYHILGNETNIFFEYAPQKLLEKWVQILNKTEFELSEMSSLSRSRIMNQFAQEKFFTSYNKIMLMK